MDIVALKVFAAVAAIFVGSAAITLVIVNPNVSGFAALIFGDQGGAHGNGKSPEAGLAANGNSAGDKNAGSASGANGISSTLSYEVMGFTKLDANLLEGQEIPVCPNSADVAVNIRNSGKYAAEKITIGANSGFAVVACDGCSIESLGSGAEKTVKMKLCRSSGQELEIAISAVNANPIGLKTNNAE